MCDWQCKVEAGFSSTLTIQINRRSFHVSLLPRCMLHYVRMAIVGNTCFCGIDRLLNQDASRHAAAPHTQERNDDARYSLRLTCTSILLSPLVESCGCIRVGSGKSGRILALPRRWCSLSWSSMLWLRCKHSALLYRQIPRQTHCLRSCPIRR